MRTAAPRKKEPAAPQRLSAPPRRSSEPATVPASRKSLPPAILLRQRFTPEGMFLNSEGVLIELASDFTLEQAVQLEIDAKAGEKKLGKGPAPQAVPDVKKLSKKEEKPKPKIPGKGGKPGKGKGLAGGRFRGAAAPTLKGVGSGKVAQYLAAKAGPVLLRGFGRLQKLRGNEQTHDNAGEKRTQVDKAEVIPLSEGQSKSNDSQVTGVSGRPAPVVDENKGKQKLQEKLAENIPKSVEDVDNFKRDMKAQHTGADVLKVVQVDKDAVVSTFQDMRQTPPPAPREHEPEALPPTEPTPATAGLNLGQGAIAPLQKEHTDVSKYTNEADSKLKEEGVTQEQLDMVDSGDLAKANTEKKGLEKAAKTEPLAVQKFAQQETTKVDKDLKQEENKERSALKAKRKAGLGATAQKQKTAKSDLEKKREEVAAKINGIYTAAQDKVKKKLADLEVQSMKRFDEGNAKASKAFEDNVNRELDAFKDDRYSGWFGWARKVRDWWKGMDDLPAVKAIFERNRSAFVESVNKLVADISADNKRVIQECKDDLQKAKAEIKDFVSKLKPSLQGIGNKAAEEMNRKLDGLDEFIAKKEEDLQNQLKDKQTAAIKAIDEKIEKMKEAMAGALAKLGKLLLWAAKKFFTWALEKFGFSLSDIESIISKGAAVLKAIFTGPIKFVKNLINAASTGFKNFGKNFVTHLKNAVFEWLTGSLEGIQLPATWDLQGILSVVFQIAGITWANIRAHLVKYIPEPVVKGLETTFDLVVTLIKDGPMAAWEQLKQIGTEMKEAFVNAIKDWIKWKIVEEAIKTVLAIFIPGAGIVKAIIAIYDTVVFFIQKAKDIMRMIANFLGSIAEIAAGNIGAAATAMEEGLARGLVLVVDFLARFLRLTGITAAIRKVLHAIKAKVDGVLDKVAKWIADKAKALIKKGVGAVKKGVAAVLQWWKARKEFSTGSETHALYFKGEGEAAELMISSVPQSLENYYKNVLKPKHAATKPEMIAIKKAIGEIAKLRQKTDMSQADGKAIAGYFEIIAPNIVALEGGEIPPSKGDWDPPKKIVGSELGKGFKAEVLSMRAGKNLSGSSPYDSTPVWGAVSARPDTYVRGHLLNHNIHGPGSNKNMTPITIKLNNKMKDQFETKLKDLVFEERKVMHFSVTFAYAQTHPDRDSDPMKNWIDEEKRLPTSVTMEAYEVEKTGTKWAKVKPENRIDFSDTHDLPKDTRPGNIPVININTTSATALDVVPGIGPARGRAIILLRAKRKRAHITRFNSYDDLKEAGIPDDVIKFLREKGRITLYD